MCWHRCCKKSVTSPRTRLTTGGLSPALGFMLTIASTPPVSWKAKHVRRSTCGASTCVKKPHTSRSRFWFSLRGLMSMGWRSSMLSTLARSEPSVMKGRMIRIPNPKIIASLNRFKPTTSEAESGSICRKIGCEIVVPYRTSLLLMLLKYSVPQKVT